MNRKQNSLMRFSRTERLAQLSEQEIVIERKKREIQAKIEAQKKKETEEALKKLESSKERPNNKFGFSKKSWTGNECQKNKNEKSVEVVKQSLTNAFSNDGSFLDQFKKLSKSGLSSDNVGIQTLAKKTEDLKKHQDFYNENLKTSACEDGKYNSYRDSGKNKNDDFKSSSNNKNELFTEQQLSDSKVQLQLPPPALAQLISQQQGVSTSDAKNPASLVPSHLAQANQIQPSESQIPFFNQNNPQSSIPQCNYSGVTDTVPSIQPSKACSVLLPSKQEDTPKSSVDIKQFPFSTTPQNIPPPSLMQAQNVSSSILPKDTELPKNRTESISLSLKPNPTKKLEPIPNPLESDSSPQKTSFSFSEKKEILNASQNDFPQKECARVSSAFYDNNEDEDVDHLSEKYHHWAQLVARCGDEFEDTLQNQHPNDPDLGFLLDKNSKKYLSYRKLVLKYRNEQNFSEQETSGEVMQKPWNNMSESSDIKDVSIPFLSVNKSKDTVTNYQNAEGESSSKETAHDKNDEEDIGNQVRHKRKRKSRWGDVVPSTSTTAAPGNITAQPLGNLPQPKSRLLSQLTRSDPGLIQYARQTFGSTNLSEEDWKKAEDHYKINLLYQDMVKKRAEVEKLERQGKFKYEYDSDEDTEGGTWEHKLRQQEMQATQLWAEELTRQAAGKHHIGDFLPPEELERFMEKYNAVKEGREPDLSDYKEYKLKEDNVGYRLLQKMGWNEGQGLGQDGTGIQNPVNKATTRHENQGLGVERPDGLEAGDDEYDAYRKRMMLAYRFRPNPLNNPRRPYY